MNKSAEQQAEERYPYGTLLPIDGTRDGFIAGHQSRDEEVKKLVEVLREVERGQYGELKGTFIGRITSLAKEALKPYLK